MERVVNTLRVEPVVECGLDRGIEVCCHGMVYLGKAAGYGGRVVRLRFRCPGVVPGCAGLFAFTGRLLVQVVDDPEGIERRGICITIDIQERFGDTLISCFR